MSMARPAAEIEPVSRIFSKSRILPGPIRSSESRSMRTLSEGRGVAADLVMEKGSRSVCPEIATTALCEQGMDATPDGLLSDANAGALQQCCCRILRRARHRGIVTHEIERDRAVDQQLKLGRKRIGVLDAEFVEQVAEPLPATFLEGGRDLFYRTVFGAELGDRVDEGAAAEILGGEPPLQ